MKTFIASFALLASFSTAGAAEISYPLNALDPHIIDFQAESVESVLPGITTTVSAAYLQTAFFSVFSSSSALLGERSVSILKPSVIGYQAVPIRFSFSVPIISANFSYYDEGGDNDGNVIIAAYDASSTFLGSTSHAYGTSNGGSSGDIPYANASYFILSTTGLENPNSLEWSIVSVTPVPEPSAAALLAGGLLLLVLQLKSPLSNRNSKLANAARPTPWLKRFLNVSFPCSRQAAQGSAATGGQAKKTVVGTVFLCPFTKNPKLKIVG